MSEQTSEITEIKQFGLITEARVREIIPSLQTGNAVGLNLLKEIQEAKITSKEEREAMVAKLATVKKIYDKMSPLRKEACDPMDTIKDYMMQYERDLDYNSKKENEYSKAKAVIIAYDQKVLEDNKHKEAEAERQRQAAIYKAQVKEGVAKQLVEMIAGQKKNIIEGFMRWEASLTLGTIDQETQTLSVRKPVLKEEVYSACFKMDFVGKRTVITDEELAKWMEEFKKEFAYAKYNEEYIQAVGPIINEYRSKMPTVKKRLEEIQKSSEAEKAKLEQTRKDELSAKSQAAIKAVDTETAGKVEQIEIATENAKMDADFQKQGQLQDLEDGPKKYEAKFESSGWVTPFMAVIGHCIKSDKFKLLNTKGEPIDAVAWWMNFFSANCPQTEVTGIKWIEVPKTIIKKK